MMTPNQRASASGVALLAVLFALTLLALLALPFAVSMGVGAEAATREVERVQAEQASASVRDLILADAALSHPVFDPTPTYDTLAEFPDRVELPAAFKSLAEDGKVLLGGQVWDLQRFLSLDSATPLVIGNLIGTTTRLREPLLPDATSMEVENAEALPESGLLWIAHEVIRYAKKQDNTLGGLQRALYQDLLFADGKNPIGAGTLVFDYRCVMAVAWPFLGRGDAKRATRRPYASVGELVEFAGHDVQGNLAGPEGIGSFSTAELDLLQEALSADTMATTAATWGRPERLFNKLEGGKSKSLRVKRPLHLGAGSTVRLRNLRTGTVEYGLVMRTTEVRNAPDLQMPSVYLELLLPVLQSYPDVDTVVEPLVPAPVNVNTASAPVLTALFSEVRQAPGVINQHSTTGVQGSGVAAISRGQARDLADAIVTQRSEERGTGTPGGPRTGPFEGWRDVAERLMKPRLDAASTSAQKTPWIVLYRNLLTGRDSVLEMGTAPICFVSGPWVGYRAAASRSRSTVAPGVASRHERTGLAAAMPGLPLEREWNTQEVLEEAFQLDRRAPWWITTPVNLGAVLSDDWTNDPASRHSPHIVPLAYPDFGLGEARFPARDAADSGFRPACSIAPSGRWGQNQVVAQHGYESFATRLNPRGHDVDKDGPYKIRNTGPRGGGASAGQGSSSSGRHEMTFPFANGDSFMDRLAVSCWLEPKSLEGVTLFDHSDGDPDRNRLSLQGKDGKLLLEVIGEEGLDPDPSQSPAGVERTAVQWSLPLADLGLPGDTPVHVNFGAYAGRPSDLSVAIDGITRGKAKYTTYLTAALKVYDPAIRANSNNIPGTRGDERYIDLQVESTEGFPSVGILRIGLELFEYTGISGNTFQCQWKDSCGGRGARQAGREFRPDIPVDSSGKPTIDFNDPSMQGVNLDVYPAHPAGSLVELYGGSALLSEDSPMMVGETRLDGALGEFAVARGFVVNPQTITIPGTSFQLGTGIDDAWVGELQLADPVPNPTAQANYPPPVAQANICDAFPTTGGYALLMQPSWSAEGAAPGQPTNTQRIGGLEVIRYASRQGNKLSGVKRNQTLPLSGSDAVFDPDDFDQTARCFICNYGPYLFGNTNKTWNEIPTLILWVVPISLAVQNASALWDPQITRLTEWVQLYPRGGDPDDTEWVRYDALVDNRNLTRANRSAWESVRYELTRSRGGVLIRFNQLGPNNSPQGFVVPPWGTVQTTADYIGYTPQLESDFPQIHAARGALDFRGDGLTRTSSHAHSNSVVTQCQRLQLAQWGNYGALTGRVGRNDRVAIIQGSLASGSARPAVEWHTVNWQCRRYESDVLAQGQTPPELLGPWPFQLVAFTDAVRGIFLGPPRNTTVLEPRKYDRVVKFPSGELPAAYCENVAIGGGVGNVQPMQGIVDEVEVMNHIGWDLLVDEAFTASAKTFRVNRACTYTSAGPLFFQVDLSESFPKTGGLVLIDNEILAYQAHAGGQFIVATNGRGLLNTEPKDHDHGARVHFLTHRPAAILAGAVSNRDNTLPVQALGAMPPGCGTVLLGRELLHYTWVRTEGDKVTLEMPRWIPPGDSDTSSGARGLFRGRFGTTVQSGSSGEPVIMFPFRYWDRYFERTDDPELAYFQLTATETPVFYRTLRWREETQDPRVSVVCLCRTDSLVPWDGVPGAGGLWQFTGSTASSPPHRIAAQASRLEMRFATVYKPGVLDLVAFRAHGWKTTARVEDVRLEYEGQGRVFDERVTAR